VLQHAVKAQPLLLNRRPLLVDFFILEVDLLEPIIMLADEFSDPRHVFAASLLVGFHFGLIGQKTLAGRRRRRNQGQAKNKREQHD
jgi:hypothetical protein